MRAAHSGTCAASATSGIAQNSTRNPSATSETRGSATYMPHRNTLRRASAMAHSTASRQHSGPAPKTSKQHIQATWAANAPAAIPIKTTGSLRNVNKIGGARKLNTKLTAIAPASGQQNAPRADGGAMANARGGRGTVMTVSG